MKRYIVKIKNNETYCTYIFATHSGIICQTLEKRYATRFGYFKAKKLAKLYNGVIEEDNSNEKHN